MLKAEVDSLRLGKEEEYRHFPYHSFHASALLHAAAAAAVVSTLPPEHDTYHEFALHPATGMSHGRLALA